MAKARVLFTILANELKGIFPLIDRANAPENTDNRVFAANALLKSFLKKYEGDDGRVSESQVSRAILTFLEYMEKSEKWEFSPTSLIDDYILGETKRQLYAFWNRSIGGTNPPLALFGIEDLGAFMRPGPGASILANGNDFYTKLFASPLSCTHSSLAFWYNHHTEYLGSWADGEKHRKLHHGLLDAVVRGSRLEIVPKDENTGRCICIEPNINMCLQLAAARFLEDRLRQVYGIGLDTQPTKNRLLARLGSRNGNFATIDLKSASDSLSLRVMKTLLPEDMFNILDKLRSKETFVPGLGWFELPIIGTMGNGFTFPLQTILFTCIVHSCYRLCGEEKSFKNNNFGVFGDDIIVERRVFNLVIRALELFGFTVNQHKTFNEGSFRESCGGDYFRGCNVRGFYLKRYRSMQDTYVAINRLTYWSAVNGINLPLTLRYLLARCKWQPVPLWESDDSGIKVPYSMVMNRCKLDKFTRSPLYRYFSAIPRKIRISSDENPAGALTAFLAGAIRNECITQRLSVAKYTRKWNVCPNWDYVATDDPSLENWVWGQRWNTAAAFNLFS